MEDERKERGYEVSIPVFEGPMDLLLHLVTKSRIDIHDIPIHEITDQYLAYLEEARRFDLELGSSFFSMAAALLLIKSRMLLPRRRQEETDEAEDPRQELARSLEEFKKMKDMRRVLEELLEQERPYHRREPAELAASVYSGRISIARLTAAFAMLFDEKKEEEEQMVAAEEVTFDDKREELCRYLADFAPHGVAAYFRRQRSRMALAVALIVLLELIRTGEVDIGEGAAGLMMRFVPAKRGEREGKEGKVYARD